MRALRFEARIWSRHYHIFHLTTTSYITEAFEAARVFGRWAMGWSWWALGNRPAMFPMLACLFGTIVGPLVDVSWPFSMALAALALLMCWARKERIGAVAFGLLGALSLGAGLAQRQATVPHPPVGTPVILEGEVEWVGSHGFTLKVSQLNDDAMHFKAALSAATPPSVLAGQWVRVEAKLKWVQDASNPGEWNRGEWAWRHGQPVSGHYRPSRLVMLTKPAAWRRWLVREQASLSKDTFAMTDETAEAALLLTLSAGQRQQLSDELEEDFAKSGLAHVLSVSGLHVAVLAFSMFAVIRWLLTRRMYSWLRRRDPRAYASLLAIPAVWAYVVFTGWQGPAVRSALMCSLVLAAWAMRRRSDALNAVAVAAVAMLLIDPAAAFDLSIQLSFLAVLALVLLSPSIRAAIPLAPPSPATQSGWVLRVSRWREMAVQTFAASCAVTLATAPILLGVFQRVSLAGLLSNIVTLPLSGVLTMVSAGGAAAHIIWPPLALPLLWLGIFLSRVFIFIAHQFAQLPGATAALPGPGVALLVGWWLGLAALILARGRWRLFALVAPAALALHLWGPTQAPDTLRVTFLAVGQGDAVILSSAGHHALVDGGGVPQGHDTGQKYVLPYLRQQRIARLDLTVLSHAHPDHALGLISTLEEVPTDRLWLPADVGRGPLVEELLDAAGEAQVEEQERGALPFRLGAAEIEVLGPPVDRSALESENDRSLVLRVRHGEVTFLLLGDLEMAGEAALNLSPATVVKAPHHGSDTSSTPELVSATKPQHVVFCVGLHNRFNFPRPDVVRRWQAAGARCHRTDLDGAITFYSDGKSVEVETFRTPSRSARRPPMAE